MTKSELLVILEGDPEPEGLILLNGQVTSKSQAAEDLRRTLASHPESTYSRVVTANLTAYTIIE